jgi:alpha-ketoglutarate-dependent taurine dioxygenase
VPRDASLTVGTLPGGFGAAEIEGLQPGDASDHSYRTIVRDALWAHGVACLRFDRALDDAETRAVAKMIGPIKDPIGRTRDGGEMRYSEDRQIIDAGFVLTDELREQLGDINFGGLDSQRPGLFETFHTDDSYVERPAAVTVLHALELPSVPGGDTHFIDMRAAYQLLEPSVRARLIGLRAVNAYNNDGAFPSRVSAGGPFEALEDVTQPVVRAHPVTGEPALYIDLDRATGIEGMALDEGRALLQLLQDHAEQRAPRYAHRWRPHDVLMWDNATVQHKAGGDFPVGEPRRFWRYMIEGSRPEAFTG